MLALHRDMYMFNQITYMHRTSILLSHELRRDAEIAARRRGISLSEMARRESYAYATEAGEELLASRALRWLDATATDWSAALTLMRKYADQGVSFTDCISFALMKREAISHVFGFDRHFRAAGFRLWPS